MCGGGGGGGGGGVCVCVLAGGGGGGSYSTGSNPRIGNVHQGVVGVAGMLMPLGRHTFALSGGCSYSAAGSSDTEGSESSGQGRLQRVCQNLSSQAAMAFWAG